MNSEKVISRNKKPFNKLLYITPIAFIASGRSALNNFESNQNWRLALSFLLFLFCGLIVIFFINAIKQQTKNTPALIISSKGIIDNISIANAGMINWNEIVKFEILKSAGHPHLFIFVKETDKFIMDQPWLKKGMITQLSKDKGSPIAIDLNQVKTDSIDLLNHLNELKTTHNNI